MPPPGYKNQVYLGEDRLIHVVYQDDQTKETVKEDGVRIEEHIKKLRAEKKPAHMLLDLRNIGKQDSGARSEAYKWLRSLDYDKIVLFGMKPFIKYVANFVIKTAGRASKIKLCNTKEEAVRWLKS